MIGPATVDPRHGHMRPARRHRAALRYRAALALATARSSRRRACESPERRRTPPSWLSMPMGPGPMVGPEMVDPRPVARGAHVDRRRCGWRVNGGWEGGCTATTGVVTASMARRAVATGGCEFHGRRPSESRVVRC